MEDQTSETWVVSVCGLNCGKCDMYEASHGNEKLRNEIVEWFRKERNEHLKPEQVRCDGCRGPPDFHWSPDCKLRLCAEEQGVHYCFECHEFPCQMLADFGSDGVSHHKRTVEDSKRMKDIGLEAWIQEQRQKGQCVFCP